MKAVIEFFLGTVRPRRRAPRVNPGLQWGWGCGITAMIALPALGAADWSALDRRFQEQVRPVLEARCHECHAGAEAKGDVDLSPFNKVSDVRLAPKIWEGILDQVDLGEMPPKKAKPLTAAERSTLLSWVRSFLDAEAAEQAGDPGPIILRRLSNAEYTYSVQDLTAVPLEPAREFPADGAAGEGFMNAGQALVMSSALFGKYLDAAKEIAAHAVLLPDGLRFSKGATRRDWSDEAVAAIRGFYARYADVEGRLPVEAYLRAALEWRARGGGTPAALREWAASRRLEARYLEGLIRIWEGSPDDPLPAGWGERWRRAQPADAAAWATEIGAWQKALWSLGTVGHRKPWMSAVQPVKEETEVAWSPAKDGPAGDATLRFVVGDAGDGVDQDVVVWERPRLSVPGREPIDLRDVRSWLAESAAWRSLLSAQAAACLKAASSAGAADRPDDELAREHGVAEESLRVWKSFLGIGGGPAALDGHLHPELRGVGGHSNVLGWGRAETPNLIANAGGAELRVPGRLKGHGVAMHPSPTHAVAVGWRSPVEARVTVRSSVSHAHPECGNGVTWSVELRQGSARRRLKQGTAAGGGPARTAEISGVQVRAGDVVSLLVGPRDGNHACDLTAIDLVLEAEPVAGGAALRWDLAEDVSPDVLAGNPHADRLGHEGVWHFYAEPVQGGDSGWTVPEGSSLAQWQSASTPADRDRWAADFQELLGGTMASGTRSDADRALREQLLSVHGPLLTAVRRLGVRLPAGSVGAEDVGRYGLPADRFGRGPAGEGAEAASLVMKAPSVVEVRLPGDLVAGARLVTTARLHPDAGREGSVQVRLTAAEPGEFRGLVAGEPILVRGGSRTEARVLAALETVRRWFPAAVCYPRVVPVDEVVTLALYHREDDALKRLVLDEAGGREIDRLWDELHFVSHDALGLVDAFQQLMEYATQDSNPALFEPHRVPIMEGAEAFRRRLEEAEPAQWEAVVRFAERAYRRPIDAATRDGLRQLYEGLRSSELPHDEALRGVLARVLVSPAFLYRPEVPSPGREAAAVSDWELATRLSYFLWSSVPDATLREAASAGRLRTPEGLRREARRMLRDSRIRRLATEFGAQWLHVHAFDELDEKSERHFPEFKEVRGPLYEEVIQFFTDFFAEDRTILELIDSDHAMLNEAMARHYGVPGVEGEAWRRVDGMRARGRGGVLGFGATLAKQSGASRTSPILRGNWVAEVLLGFKLPKPPKNVPQLPEDEVSTAELTLRQVVERHSSVPECAGCHRHIDAYGFALEGYDPLGRVRERDAAARALDTRVALPDGTRVGGAADLKKYLMEQRREVFVAQFCRKLLGYALGRGVRLSDKPLLAEMQVRLAENGYRVSVALESVLASRQFLEIRGVERAEEP